MAQTELLNSISKSIDYPVEQNLSASYHCGTFSLIVDTDLWTEQMYYELPWIQLDIYITVGGIDIKYLSCNIMLDTDEPKKPYSVSVYEIPGSFKVKLTPGFDDNVITTHNELCLQEDISNTWGPQTLEFPCSVVWDDSNISSSSSVTPADLCTYTIIRSTDSNYAAIYKLQQTKNSISTFVGNTINIPKDMVIQSGTVETCEHNDVPIIGYVVGDKYLDLIISNSSNEHIYILLNDLVDLSASNISYNNSNSGLDSTNVNNAIDELSSKKVDKETGKGLSTNDYTDAEKTKLAGIEEQANRTTVDDVLSDASTNPVQNKVVKAALDSKADSADIPAVPITAIQKNGADITPVGGTVDIIVPTTAEDVEALPDTTKYAASLSLTINSSTFVMTVQLKDQDNNDLGTAQTIDLPLESVVVGGSYDDATKKVVLALQNGNIVEFSVADLVAGLQTELSASNKLNPAYINYDSEHRAVTDAEKSSWNGKQDALTTAQLAAVDSGIDSAKVKQIATNQSNIDGQQNTTASGGNGYAIINGIRFYVASSAPTGNIPDGSAGVGW